MGNRYYRYYNPNPTKKNVGDCTVRAISKAMDKTWDEAYAALASYGFMMCDMPSSNAVWGAYLKSRGFKRDIIPDSCSECYTVREFISEHGESTYVLSLSGHVVCVRDGILYDSWDSSGEVPLYYWYRE